MTREQTIGAELRERRVAIGMTEQGLAAEVGVSAAALHLWEQGKRFPNSLMRLIKWGSVLGIDIEVLLSPHAPQDS